jgi:hypothetical protein
MEGVFDQTEGVGGGLGAHSWHLDTLINCESGAGRLRPDEREV